MGVGFFNAHLLVMRQVQFMTLLHFFAGKSRAMLEFFINHDMLSQEMKIFDLYQDKLFVMEDPTV